MPVKILEDGSYDLRGATPEDVDSAIDDYFNKTPPEKNVFLMDKPEGVIGKVRAKIGDIVEDVKLFFN